MQQVTGRECVDVIAMEIQVIDASDSLKLLAVMNSYYLTHMAHMNIPEDGCGTAQMANNKTNLITSWLENTSEPV